MALIGYSPWEGAAQVGSGIGQSLSQVLLQLPLLRAQMAQNAAQLAIQRHRYESEAEADVARAGYYRAQTAGVEARKGLGNALATEFLGRNPLSGAPTLENAQRLNVADVLRNAGMVTDNPQQVGEFAKTFLALLGAPPERSPELSMAIQTGQRLPAVLGEGENLMSVTGRTLAEGRPRSFSPGMDLSKSPTALATIARIALQGGDFLSLPLEEQTELIRGELSKFGQNPPSTQPRKRVREYDPMTGTFR